MTERGNLIYPQLSYKISGVLFSVHNELGCYAKEKQYGNVLEKKLNEQNIKYQREVAIGNSGNIVDFIIDSKILLELKAKRALIREDFEQTQRYLQETQLKLGILVNFRNQYLKPVRIVKIDTQNKTKFQK